MQLHVKGSFNRDRKKINNKALNKELFKRIEKMEKATTIDQIPYFKRLIKYSHSYKSEIVSGNKIYWLLCYIFKDEIYLIRLKPESYFKKYLR